MSDDTRITLAKENLRSILSMAESLFNRPMSIVYIAVDPENPDACIIVTNKSNEDALAAISVARGRIEKDTTS